jgi:hypothetical protein
MNFLNEMDLYPPEMYNIYHILAAKGLVSTWLFAISWSNVIDLPPKVHSV